MHTSNPGQGGQPQSNAAYDADIYNTPESDGRNLDEIQDTRQDEDKDYEYDSEGALYSGKRGGQPCRNHSPR